MSRAADDVRLALTTLASWPRVRWLAALGATSVAALVSGAPTDLVPTGLYTRMTPVSWWAYPVWALSAVLVGLTFATYVRSVEAAGGGRLGRTTLGALATTLAVGCPVCNRLIVGLLGASGALRLWAPAQPLVGVVSVVALAAGLVVRLRGSVACAVTVERGSPAAPLRGS